MTLDADGMYRALESRDRRFEGLFVVGVRTTGIYCRPGCPARIPLRRNVRFYPSAAAAQAAGLRPCLRCRPDSSPGTPAAMGTPVTVRRALRLIADGALDEAGVDPLAERLGVTARHLRRLFDQHLGASPLAVARTQRAHFARKLLEETRLPMTEVAHAAGFASLRRFNDAIRDAFQATPTELRGARGVPAPATARRAVADARRAARVSARTRRAAESPATAASGALELRLPYRPPLALAELLAFLGRRAIPGVERVDADGYARTLAGDEAGAHLTVRDAGDGRHLRLAIHGGAGQDLYALAARVRRVFDLDADPLRIDAHLGRDPRLARGVAARPGLRVPGAWDAFELAVRAVLGQQVSVAGATTLAGRLVARFGRRLPHPAGGLTHLFPEAAALVDADVASIGLPAARAETIRGLARAVAAGVALPEGVADVRGVGPWTIAYVAMRAGRDPDAFPASDLGVRRALAAGKGALPSVRDVEAMSEPWRPWRAYAALHLWTMEHDDDDETR